MFGGRVAVLWNREGFGKSCYRLKRKNGDFIYMVTHGYLEPCEDLHRSTFVCVNTLVSSEEGEREIRNMKKKFTPIIERKDEPAIAAIAEKYNFCGLQVNTRCQKWRLIARIDRQ